ncbi:NAD(P)/FAD-dependent oxidoreductase [Maribacter sp. PR1]|uniref:NAD(P)/FAD-dependent oxidoreductase n=1 Tax=Maribacter cobaltidurans TaxID=1178778 RepID=A0ABU7IPX0_9FLAO|nr:MULTISPECIES: NAD(P)/FAD-dependent oxidoreductase [Maribacter]MDC6387619.1 NAD(P)/FAD-dependent oxidoreductase [Maribacter sp. PR1]MEE1975007.1 NAD(P)/FAD-dependent oxidoreductase [Maribacter cobaltidurans]
MKEEKIDVLVIGAGPSGSVAASYLFNKGFSVKVVEKNKFPRFVIGESLIPRCMDHFEAVGLMDCLKEKGFEVKTGARFLQGKKVCEFDFSKKHTKGWDWTWQVPRAEFDKTLTDELLKRGVDVEFEKEVTGVSFNGNHSRTTIVDKEGTISEIEAKFIIDSSGFGRVLPRLLDLEKPSVIPKHSSIFTHVKDVRKPEGWEGHRITFDIVSQETWLWVIPFSNGYTSIGYVGPTDYLESFEGTTEERLRQMMKLSTHYNDRFDGLPYEFEPKMIKNIAKSVKQLYGKGYVLTGNSAEFLDPVFSSGVTFATESAHLSAQLIARELNGERVDWETEYSQYMLEGVDVFSTYVKEWYTGNLQKIFFTDSENPIIKKQICSVLAGYVWDRSNPFVKNHHRLVRTVAHITDMEKENAGQS